MHSFSVRYRRNSRGSAQVRVEKGTGITAASVTQQWPKQNTFCRFVERTASRWLPMPKTLGPFFGARVSSTAIRSVDLGVSKLSSTPNARWHISTRLQVPLEKKRG